MMVFSWETILSDIFHTNEKADCLVSMGANTAPTGELQFIGVSIAYYNSHIKGTGML